MKAPILNRALILETPDRIPDGAGGFKTIWTALGLHWAHVDARSAGQITGAASAVSRVKMRITVRAAPMGAASRPKPEQRFREGSRIFQIEAVSDADSDGRYLICYVSEEVSV
ncbi:phage tail protein [Marivivens niveibacter]|uniref:Phage tail protein n=1 Tax=Marivivens niveibacter TaxID=1930667 RepID=A0A251X269_9RHOB|nr:head-tail adaptor protein [Marivivens niveibacter]OUD10696.1 phage tail protein [Marivivens niveibacter]